MKDQYFSADGGFGAEPEPIAGDEFFDTLKSPRAERDLMLERLYRICLDNDFDGVTVNGGTLECRVPSFAERYRLEARERGGVLEIDLADCAPLAATPEVLAFLRRHDEPRYPLRRTVASPEEIQDALDDLQSAADDLFGFSHDLAEARHTSASADAALEANFALRDTPFEISQLDCRAAGMMHDRRTLWYPSAGDDFRDLIFCSGRYPGIDLAPELFVHTDCSVRFDLDSPGRVHEDAHTAVTLHPDREFDRMTVPHREFAHWECEDAGRVRLYRAEIVSDRFGTITRPLIYAVCENEWFAAEFLAPNRVAVDTVCHVRYGNGFGGAVASGAWLLRALKLLRTRHYLSDPALGMQDADEEVLRRYPQLAGAPVRLVPGKTIPGKFWSKHGDVTVYEVR